VGVVENVGVAVGISLISLPVPEIQSTSGLTAAILILSSRPTSDIVGVTPLKWAWSKMSG
jgi:hypothetical protein